MKAVKTFIKYFGTPQRSVKKKLYNFSFLVWEGSRIQVMVPDDFAVIPLKRLPPNDQQ